MINDKTIAVVVPAFNEETQIAHVLNTMPEFVDRIVVVNDNSSDRTAEVVLDLISKSQPAIELRATDLKIEKDFFNEALVLLNQMREEEIKFFAPSKIMNQNPTHDRIILINNLDNSGVGAAIARGYKWCKDHDIDCTAVMAGDGQMDPSELEGICLPVLEDGVDYVKGNRLIHPSATHIIPKTRFIGNSILSILTKIASGYWRISDTQTGYTAISKRALNRIKIYRIYNSYGMPNDLLVKLNMAMCTIKEIEIKPVYRVGEKSKMKILKVIPRVSFLLFRCFFKRLWIKYFWRDFHPLFLFYNLAMVLGLLSLPYFCKVIKAFWNNEVLNNEPLFAFVFLTISTFQSLIFAMWMDILDNERLYRS